MTFSFIFHPAVEEEALNSIMKDLAALGRCYATAHKPKTRTLSYKQVHEKLRHSFQIFFFILDNKTEASQMYDRKYTELAVLSEVVGDWNKKKIHESNGLCCLSVSSAGLHHQNINFWQPLSFLRPRRA